MAGDNLTVQIGADTSKLRADLKLAQVQFQELNKQMTAAAKQAAATGDRTNLDKLSKEADAAAKSYQNLNRQLAAANRTVGDTKVWSAASGAVNALNTQLLGLAKTVAAGLGFGALASLVNRTKDEILEINRLSLATGFEPTALKAFNETLEDTGAEAGAGNRALVRLSGAYAKVRQDARAADESVGEATRVLRGSMDNLTESAQKTQRAAELASGVDVRRGAQRTVQTIKDEEDAFAALGVEWRKFPQTMRGQRDMLQAVIDGFGRLRETGKTELANLAAAQLLGARSAAEYSGAIDQLQTKVGGLNAKIAELESQGRGIGPDAVKNALEYQKALKDVGDQADKVGFAFLRAFGPTMSSELRKFATDIDTIGLAFTQGKGWEVLKWLLLGGTPPSGGPTIGTGDIQGEGPNWIERNWIEPTRNAIQIMEQLFVEWFGKLRQLFTDAWKFSWDSFTSYAKSAIDTVSGWLQSLASVGRTVFSMIASVVAPAASARADSNLSDLGFAAGGRVRGRGTGTSDSILARLSNGEFVVNAAATSRFLPLLRAINDGMSQPLMPRTSFATGGLVMATDAATGTPVHLHIGGHSFPMRTDSIVAESLIRTAREKQLLSAGRKPSWAGGRRYGG